MKAAVVVLTTTLLAFVSLVAGGLTTPTADTYQVDPIHSSMVFRVKHMGAANFYGRFNNISGSFTLDDADPTKSSFQITIQAESVDTANPKRDQHLKSPDFFNTKQFPTIAFKSTAVKKSGADTLDVAGDLTLHGVTKPVTAKVTKTGTGSFRGRQLAGVEASLAIKRSDFGMSFMLEGLSDDVQITVSLEGGR